MPISGPGAKQITIGIKIGTDLKPFIDKVSELKTKLKDLEQAGSHVDALKGKFAEWQTTIDGVNSSLDTTADKLRAIAQVTSLHNLSGGVAPAMGSGPVTVVQKAAPLGGSRNYRFPVNIFSAEHQLMLTRANGYASRLDPRQLTNLTSSDAYMQASSLYQQLNANMRIPAHQLQAQQGVISQLERRLQYASTPAWVTNRMTAMGVSQVDAQIMQRTRVMGLDSSLNSARTAFQNMQLGNDLIDKLGLRLQGRADANQAYLTRHGMQVAGVSVDSLSRTLQAQQPGGWSANPEPQVAAQINQAFNARQMLQAGIRQRQERQRQRQMDAMWSAHDRANKPGSTGNLNAEIREFEQEQRDTIADQKMSQRAVQRYWSRRATSLAAASKENLSDQAWAASIDRSEWHDPWRAGFNQRMSQATGITTALRDAKRWGGTADREGAAAMLGALRREREQYAAVRDGGAIPHLDSTSPELAKALSKMTPEEATKAHRAVNATLNSVSSALRGVSDEAKNAGSSIGSVFKTALGFGTAVAAVHTLTAAMKQLYAVALDVDNAFAQARASVSRIADPNERRAAFNTITGGMMSDSKRTGMSVQETFHINDAVYFGSNGSNAEKAALARTLTNMQFTGALNTDESLATLPAMKNAGFGASETRAFFEKMNALQGRMKLDPQRMRAFMSATAANLPALGNVASWEDVQAWALQEASGSRDMVMGSKLNRIQIGLQNQRTLKRLSEILSKKGARSTVGGEDIESIINSGNPMATLGKLQSLSERGVLSEGEITQVGQAIDMWNSPGTIQVLKGGLEPYRKMLRESEVLASSGLVTSDQAASERANSLQSSVGQLGAHFKELLMSLSPLSDGFKSFVSGLGSLVSALGSHAGTVKTITQALLAVAATIGVNKAINGAGSIMEGIGSKVQAYSRLATQKGGFGNLALSALGGWGGVTTLGVSTALVAGAMYMNHREDKINAASSERNEATRVGATTSALHEANLRDDFYKFSSMAGEYRQLVEAGKGAGAEAVRLKEKLVAMLPAQANGEAHTLDIMRGQTAELQKQIDAKLQLTQDAAKDKTQNLAMALSLGMHYQRSGDLTGAQAVNMIQPAVQLAARSKDPQLQAWGKWAASEWGKYTNAGQFDKETFALNAMSMHQSRLSAIQGFEVGQNDQTDAAIHALSAAGGAAFKSREYHWYRPNDLSGSNGSFKDMWGLMLSTESQSVVANAYNDGGHETFLRTIAAQVGNYKASGGKSGVSPEDASRIVGSYVRGKVPEKDRKGFLALGDTIVKQLHDSGVGAVKASGRKSAAYNSQIDKEATLWAENEGARSGIMGAGGELMYQSEGLAGALRMTTPDVKPGGGPVDFSRGRDPFSVIRRFTQDAKQFAQAGDSVGLAQLMSNPMFSQSRLNHLINREWGEVKEDMTIGMMGDAEKELARLAFEADKQALKAFINPSNLKKLHTTAASGMLKQGAWSNGAQVFMGSDDLAQQVFDSMGAVPLDEAAAQRYHLQHALKTAQLTYDHKHSQFTTAMNKMADTEGINPESAQAMRDAARGLSTQSLEKDRMAIRAAQVNLTKFDANQAYMTGMEGVGAFRTQVEARSLFGTAHDSAKDMHKLLSMEMAAEQAKLSILSTEPELLKDQQASRKRISELLLQQLQTMEQAQRVIISTREGRAFSASVVSELIAGDNASFGKNIKRIAGDTTKRGLITQANTVLDGLESQGGIGNPLAAIGRMLYDPSGAMSKEAVEKAVLSATELNTQATQQNTIAVANLVSALTGTPSTAGNQMPINSTAVSGLGQITPLQTVAASVGSNSPVGTMGGGIGALTGSSIAAIGGAGSLLALTGLTGKLGENGMGTLTGTATMNTKFGPQMFKSYSRFSEYTAGTPEAEAAGFKPVYGNPMDPNDVTAYKDVHGNVVQEGMKGVGVATNMAQMGFLQWGVNPFSQTNTVNGKNVVGGFWKTDANGNSTGKVNWGNAGAAGFTLAASMYSGYMDNQGNGQAARNEGALANGALGAAGMVAMWNPYVAGALALFGIMMKVASASNAAEHQAHKLSEAYDKQVSDMERLIRSMEEERKEVGLSAERILSARADVGNAFQGVAASAFLSGRYSQTAPTIQVQQLVVQANNPSELASALANGVAAEIRKGG